MVWYIKLLLIIISIFLLLAIKYFWKTLQCGFLINKINRSLVNTKRNSLSFFRYRFLKLTNTPVVLNVPTTFFLDEITVTYTKVRELFPDSDYTHHYTRMLQEAAGFYWEKMKDYLNPFYWVDCIFNLPSNLFKYLGLNTSKFYKRLINFFSWLINLLIVIFRPDIRLYLINLINKLFDSITSLF